MRSNLRERKSSKALQGLTNIAKSNVIWATDEFLQLCLRMTRQVDWLRAPNSWYPSCAFVNFILEREYRAQNIVFWITCSFCGSARHFCQKISCCIKKNDGDGNRLRDPPVTKLVAPVVTARSPGYWEPFFQVCFGSVRWLEKTNMRTDRETDMARPQCFLFANLPTPHFFFVYEVTFY